MSELKKVTAIILTYKTPKNIILNCLKSINRGINIMIVENSKSFEHQKIIKKKFPKIKIFCTGKNLGYGKGNNFGLSEHCLEKKSPLTMPPSYGELPIPSSEKTNKENQTNNIESLISKKNNEKIKNDESDKNFEQSILDKIKDN